MAWIHPGGEDAKHLGKRRPEATNWNSMPRESPASDYPMKIMQRKTFPPLCYSLPLSLALPVCHAAGTEIKIMAPAANFFLSPLRLPPPFNRFLRFDLSIRRFFFLPRHFFSPPTRECKSRNGIFVSARRETKNKTSTLHAGGEGVVHCLVHGVAFVTGVSEKAAQPLPFLDLDRLMNFHVTYRGTV